MYKDEKDWIVEFYKHYAKVEGITELKIEKQTLKSENDMQFVLLNLIRSNILNLPSLEEIRWKLIKRGNVELKKTKERGKIIEEYDLENSKMWIMDGESFKIQVNCWNKKNEFEQISSISEFLLSCYSIKDMLNKRKANYTYLSKHLFTNSLS